MQELQEKLTKKATSPLSAIFSQQNPVTPTEVAELKGDATYFKKAAAPSPAGADAVNGSENLAKGSGTSKTYEKSPGCVTSPSKSLRDSLTEQISLPLSSNIAPSTSTEDGRLKQATKQAKNEEISTITSIAVSNTSAKDECLEQVREQAATKESTATRSKPENVIESQKQIVSLEISSILPNPNQPRKSFSEPSILRLADSIRQFGIIQPLTVRKLGQYYELVAGERRLRAAKELGWKRVPCIITNTTDEQSAQLSIIENLIREDLNIFEQALAIESLIDTYEMTQEQIAEKLSASQSYIANKLRLLRLSAEEREIILANQLTERHARALLRINDANTRKSFLAKIIKSQLNVTSTEILIGEYLSNQAPNSSVETQKPHHSKTILSFYNTINKAIDSAKANNLDIKYQKFVGETYTEIILRFPSISKSKDNTINEPTELMLDN